ncbi:unnamed protein product [Discula destructiva]
MSSEEDLDDEGLIMPHVEDQRLARSETSSPLMTSVPSVQQVIPLRLDIPDDWSLPTYYANDGLFGDLEQPIMSASLSTDAATWPYSLPFPSAFSGESNAGSAAASFSWDSLLTLASDDQANLEAAAGLDIDKFNGELQQNFPLQQPFVPAPSEPDYFANAWEPLEYATMDGNADVNEFNRDPFFQ